jgi:hypothetical protein
MLHDRRRHIDLAAQHFHSRQHQPLPERNAYMTTSGSNIPARLIAVNNIG